MIHAFKVSIQTPWMHLWNCSEVNLIFSDRHFLSKCQLTCEAYLCEGFQGQADGPGPWSSSDISRDKTVWNLTSKEKCGALNGMKNSWEDSNCSRYDWLTTPCSLNEQLIARNSWMHHVLWHIWKHVGCWVVLKQHFFKRLPIFLSSSHVTWLTGGCVTEF